MSIRMVPGLITTAVTTILVACGPTSTDAPSSEPAATAQETKPNELKRVVDRMMAPPDLRAEPGFSVRLLVPPGEIYDALFLRDYKDKVLVTDDGGEEDGKGGRILLIDRQGALTPLVPLGRVLPVIGVGIAPEGFGPYQGQIVTLAQPAVAMIGAQKNHVIQVIEPEGDNKSSLLCTLPNAGTEAKGIAGYGGDARFGPEGSPFAGKFFAVTSMNYTVYQVTGDGKCTPFATFDKQKWGYPGTLAFSADGQHMFVSVGNERSGAIARVRPDGKIEAEPLLRKEGLRPGGMAYAPATFGEYAGQLFVAGREGTGTMMQTHAPPSNGKLYRLTPQGELKLVASGFRSPAGLHFVDDRLWVSDVNGDFIAGYRELPDGFVAEIALAR